MESSSCGNSASALTEASISQLTFEVNTQKRSLSRAFTEIEELRTKGEGLEDEVKRLASATTKLASAAASSSSGGAGTEFAEIASGVATAAAEKENAALRRRLVALEERVQAQEEASRRHMTATAALTAAGDLSGAAAPSSASPQQFDALNQRVIAAEARVQELQSQMRTALSSGGGGGTTNLAAIDSLRQNLRAELRADLRAELSSDLRREALPAMRSDVTREVRAVSAEVAEREVRSAASRVVPEMRNQVHSAIGTEVESAVAREVNTAVQQRSFNQQLLHTAVRTALQEIRTSEGSGRHTATAAEETFGTGSSPTAMGGCSSSASASAGGGVVTPGPSATEKMNSLRMDLEEVRSGMTRQLTQLASQHAETDRVTTELRLSLPRLHTTVDAHAASIRQIEGEVDALTKSSRRSSDKISEAYARAEAHVTRRQRRPPSPVRPPSSLRRRRCLEARRPGLVMRERWPATRRLTLLWRRRRRGRG